MIFDNFPKVSPAGMPARVFLAFLASAGLFYINILPTIVDGLIQALGFTNQQAGAVASANIYGAATGALLIVFLVRHINWRFASLLFLLVMAMVFQAVFSWAAPLMDLIDAWAASLGELVRAALPPGAISQCPQRCLVNPHA